ncbi:MAG: arsenate reductase family protein [Thiovulaceae bacterium]|nr:arsenate reductase family protein [Sulfurimonadaceae bacterium]MCW9025787.1 arsenate reductase family protein [Sulfurimonadaceae bacterium]
MIKVYGIPTCGSVRNARKFFKDNAIEVEFIDFKKTTVGCEKVDEWLKHIDIEKLFNSKGTKYRNLKLKELNLDADGKKEWLCKENMLFKRPVIEYNNSAMVGWNEEVYKDTFIN